jgi:hypothetical protein
MAMLYGFDPTVSAEPTVRNVERLILVTVLPPSFAT